MGDICGDNRFEIIAKAKAKLLESTNIETSEDEMKVLDNFLFRCWQMGWLDRYDSIYRCDSISEEEFAMEWANFDFADSMNDIIRKRIEENKRRIEQTLEGAMLHTGVVCPEGYIFVDENGNVINATKIVLEKKKKEYPKTYEECCEVMNYCCNPVAVKTTHKEELIRKFQFLLLYRDAYWKIAGEEMGLEKPWEPDWCSQTTKYTLRNNANKIIKEKRTHDSYVLAFPTEEIRDAFYENFKELIEQCKELL